MYRLLRTKTHPSHRRADHFLKGRTAFQGRALAVHDRGTGKPLERTKIFHEEMQAVNTELPTKMNDLSRANNDMNILLAPCNSWKGKKDGGPEPKEVAVIPEKPQ